MKDKCPHGWQLDTNEIPMINIYFILAEDLCFSLTTHFTIIHPSTEQYSRPEDTGQRVPHLVNTRAPAAESDG